VTLRRNPFSRKLAGPLSVSRVVNARSIAFFTHVDICVCAIVALWNIGSQKRKAAVQFVELLFPTSFDAINLNSVQIM